MYQKSFAEKKVLKKEIQELKEENEKLKAEQFDNMEELAKSEGMCLVDIEIMDRLIDYEEENKKSLGY